MHMSHQWKEGSGTVFSSYNPATGELCWKGNEAAEAEVNEAVNQATDAFERWSALAIGQRTHYLSDYGEVLNDSRSSLAETISKETGKPFWESLSEIDSMINKVKISLEAYGRRCAGMIRDLPTMRSITRHRPHGVVAVLGPYNFPGHLPNGHIIPALLAGNTVVFKPSEYTPLVAEELFRCWQKVELPQGVLKLVQGGKNTGKALVNHPDIQGLFFTGSYETGCYLSEQFGKRPDKILALEMGGNNPLIIGQINDLHAAAYLIVQSAYLTSGQRCTCARRLILANQEHGDELLAILKELIQSLSIGSYTDRPEPFMGPVISEQHAQLLLNAQTNLLSLEGKPLVEMKLMQSGTGFISPGLMDVTSIVNRPDEEIFGPFLQIIRVKNFQDALEEANRTKFGLSAGLFSDNEAEYQYFYQKIRAGIVNWNTPLTGASSTAPFGGIKNSGNHHPSGYYAADYCSYPVASHETQQLVLPSALLPGIRVKEMKK